MKDFLDTAQDLWRSRKITAIDSFQKVFDGISELSIVHSKSRLDIHNVESVFAAFEMGKTLGRFGTYSIDKIEELVNAIRQVIVQTIETTVKLPVPKNERPHAPAPYGDFANLLKYIFAQADPPLEVAVITFNYDIAVEYCFYENNIPFNYSLEESIEGIPLLKLHGSLNWAYCSACNKVIPWHLNSYLERFPFTFGDKHNATWSILDIGSKISDFGICSNCKKTVSKEPVIIPPTWNKIVYCQDLPRIWSRAAEVLSTAENIFVIGYSLPESDLFFRYLYALGTSGRTIFRRFWVFNPDPSHVTEERFRILLGPGALDRYEYKTCNFQDSLGVLRGQLKRKK
jgi:hypothetical protein